MRVYKSLVTAIVIKETTRMVSHMDMGSIIGVAAVFLREVLWMG